MAAQQKPEIHPKSGHSVQLVHLDKEETLILDEEALSHCLEQSGVRDAPVCLLSIIGEQRRGKSFLMNCLLRRLWNMEATDKSWLDQDDETLGGFECRAGMATVTKGVWMWNQPLWVQAQGRKVAVFLVDTEGSLDLQRNMETSIKLSIFSILLSSYWIFNISCTFKQTEADYLEMFIQVAKEIGETYNLAPIQPLDLLVRDWPLSESYGEEEGHKYLRTIIQDFTASGRQPLVLEALRADNTHCCLLPHPGPGFIRSRRGRPGDMDEDFQQFLCDYVSNVAHSAGTHVRMDQTGRALTGAQLAETIKGISCYLKNKSYDFSSPMKMSKSLMAMREKTNRRVVEAAMREYEQFVNQEDHEHQDMIPCLKVEPEEMQRCLEGKRQELLQHCQGELLGEETHRQEALEKLKLDLARKMDQFLLAYRQCYKAAMREANSRAVDTARKDYEQFVQELDRGHQELVHCLKVKSEELQHHLEGKQQDLLQRCQGELQGEDPDKQAALKELEQELSRQMELFVMAYGWRYKMAETALREASRRVVDTARKEYEQFVQELDHGHQDMIPCLKVEPEEMQQRLDRKCQELQQRCDGELLSEDPHRQAALEELEQELVKQTERFLPVYSQRYREAMMKESNSRAVDAARREYEQFVQDLDYNHQDIVSCLMVKPQEMQQRLEGKRRRLLQHCQEELQDDDSHRQVDLEQLELELAKQMDQFLLSYKQRNKMAETATREANKRAVETATMECEQFVQDLHGRDHQDMNCRKVKPEEMRRCLEAKCWELWQHCRWELWGEDSHKQAALDELEQEMDHQMDQLLKAYEQHYESHETNPRKEAAKTVPRSKAAWAAFPGKEDLTLDPDTAHPLLEILADGKQVKCGSTKRSVKTSPKRFNRATCVVAKQSFSNGRHYWVVSVGQKWRWTLGVVSAQAARQGRLIQWKSWWPWSEEVCAEGYWMIGYDGWKAGKKYWVSEPILIPIDCSHQPQTIGVYLDYPGRQVTFFNADKYNNLIPLYSFYNATFKNTSVYPVFDPCYHDKSRNTEPLKIL